MLKSKVFRYKDAQITDEGHTLLFTYEVVSDTDTYQFQETLTLPVTISGHISDSFIMAVLRDLHLILGISYFKAFCPTSIDTGSIHLTKEQTEFWDTVFTKGLGEFYYKNKIDYRRLISFPFSDAAIAPAHISTNDTAITGMSGGKDSLVTIELLRSRHIPVNGFFVSMGIVPSFITQIIDSSDIKTHIVKRQIDPRLLELNKTGEVYNGHIPVSIVYALVGVLLAGLSQTKFVIVSNEQSSNAGNVDYLGMTVNHQWSKSSEFEDLFRSYVHRFITPDITYFSLLRPFSELEITQKFADYPKYFHLFSSCNRNFRMQKTTESLWCGECPKCAFVFLMLAAVTDRKTTTDIFHKNLFADDTIVPLYRSLAGVSDVKPFDCVGTFEEVRDAMKKVYHAHEFDDDVVIKMYVDEIKDTFSDDKQVTVDTYNIPDMFKNIVE